jgi:hypothetical protein
MVKYDVKTGQASADLIHKHYKQRVADWRRGHLGASILGNRCDRFLWLSFRWALDPQHDGRQLRLFERGKREELWVLDDFRAIDGIEVRDNAGGKQISVRWGHVAGSVDGIIRGLPEDPNTEHVLEIKTHNLKSFTYLKEKGVKAAKREHWIQMQTYMLGLGLERAFYVAVCKDTDDVYGEIVKFEKVAAEDAVERGQRIVAAVEPPPRLDHDQAPCLLVGKDGKQWPCQFYSLCHGAQLPERNCRTCCFSTPETKDGDVFWTCFKHPEFSGLDGERQRSGCQDQMTIPPIVNAQVSFIGGRPSYQFKDGKVAEEHGPGWDKT